MITRSRSELFTPGSTPTGGNTATTVMILHIPFLWPLPSSSLDLRHCFLTASLTSNLDALSGLLGGRVCCPPFCVVSSSPASSRRFSFFPHDILHKLFWHTELVTSMCDFTSRLVAHSIRLTLVVDFRKHALVSFSSCF